MHRLLTFALIAALAWMSGLTAGAQELRVLSTRPQPELMNYIEEHVIPAFESTHGIKVTFEYTSWDDRMDRILISTAAGVPYDIVFTGFYSPYEEGSAGLLAPLDAYLERWEHYSKYPRELWETQSWNGRTYSVPIEVQTRGIGYNKELYGQAGIGADQTPLNWEEFVQYTRMLTQSTGDTTVTQRGYNLSTGGSGGAQNFLWWMRQNGLTEFDATTQRSNLDQPGALETLEFLLNVHQAAMADLPGAPGGLAGRNVAMMTVRADHIRDIYNNHPDLAPSIGLFAPRRSMASEPVSHAFINGLAITDASTQKDQAWLFLAALLETEALINIQRNMGWISGRIDLMEDLIEFIPTMELFMGMFPYLHAPIIPAPQTSSQQDLGSYLSQVFAGRISPQEGLLQTHHVWTRLLDEWNRTHAGR